MTKPADDFEAVRQLVETLTPFDNQDRERIIRWAREKLGMTGADPGGLSRSTVPGSPPVPPAGTPAASDIRSFLTSKNPSTDTQLVAAVAYFYRFVSPAGDRKETVTAADVVEACRQADRKRPARAAQSMVNAFKAGVVDRVDGGYKLNTVGENLVAVVLGNGGDGAAGNAPRRPRTSRVARTKKGSKKAKK